MGLAALESLAGGTVTTFLCMHHFEGALWLGSCTLERRHKMSAGRVLSTVLTNYLPNNTSAHQPSLECHSSGSLSAAIVQSFGGRCFVLVSCYGALGRTPSSDQSINPGTWKHQPQPSARSAPSRPANALLGKDIVAGSRERHAISSDWAPHLSVGLFLYATGPSRFNF